MKIDKIFEQNQYKFSQIKKLNLPLGQYIISGSAPLGIRNLRLINDIDIMVSLELWNKLASQYSVIREDNIEKIILLDGSIEILHEGSFINQGKNHDNPSFNDRVKKADIIDGLPFESLTYTLYFKYQMGRDKDLKDIALLEDWQTRQKNM